MFYNSPKQKHLCCAIYRGPGGSGDAVNDSSSETRLAVEARDAALAAQAAAEAAQAAAETAETNAETAETNAETAETNAETAATNAASSASAASTSASNASSSASSASTSATNAASSASSASSSASAASTSATNAATSATNAANSATAAATSATNASNSATAAASSASSASSSASTATTQASNASTSATNAASSATSAASSASTATTQAGLASTSATNAANSASAASTSATNASNSASAASTSASNAATSATNAASSATSAASSASSAQSASDAALAALDSFDDRYLGQKSSAPTVDNDGNALVTGALYFDTVSNAMKVWDGTQWLSAYASLSGALLATNNLSDLISTSTARTNLGVAIGTDVQAYDADTAKLDVSQSWSAAQSFNAGVTLGDASGDALTINSSAVSIPNGLNFDSNTLVIDATNNAVLVGTATNTYGKFTVSNGTNQLATGFSTNTPILSAVNNAGNAYVDFITDASTQQFRTGGTERMRLDSSGNLGLGVTPSAWLSSYKVIDFTGGSIQGGTTGDLQFYQNAYRNASGNHVYRNTAAASMLDIGSGGYYFYTAPSGTAGTTFSWSNTAYIGTSGFSVGGLSPDTFARGYNTNISVTSTGIAAIGVKSATGNNAYIDLGVNTSRTGSLYTTGSQLSLAAIGALPITFETNSNERMRIDSSGNVGIGTSSPSYKLDVLTTDGTVGVASKAASGAIALIPYLDSTNGAKLAAYNNAISAFSHLTIDGTYLRFNTSNVERMRLDSSGNLGLGVTPSAWGTGTLQRAIEMNGGCVWSFGTSVIDIGANWYYNSSNQFIYKVSQFATAYRQRSDNGQHQWYTAPSGTAGNAITFTQAMTLDASGNLGIGTSSPSSKLHVSSTSVYTARFDSTSTTSNNILLVGGSSYNYGVVGVATGNGTSGGDVFTLGYTASAGTAATPVLNWTSTGNVGIGSTSPTTAIGSGNTGLVITNSTTNQAKIHLQNSTSGYTASSGALYSFDGTDVYQWNYQSGTMRFGTNNAERMRIDSSGNVLIGSTTFDNAGFSGGANGLNVVDATHPIILTKESTTGVKAFLGNTGTQAYLWTPSNIPFTFGTNDTERMRIDSSGNLLFNTTSNANSSRVRISSSNPTTGYVLELQQTSSNAGTYYYQAFYVNTTQTGYISSNGTTTTYATSSDYRLKENVAPMTGALAKNALLKPVTYTWKADGSVGEGFIAHELAEVMPQAVTGEKDAVNEDGSIKPQGIDTSFLVGHLVACIQELKAEVDSLKAQLNK